jgi:hypothetical protein
LLRVALSAPQKYESVRPTHKRAEGRAPLWGSEFTTKAAPLHGGSSRSLCWAERKIVGSGVRDCVPGRELPLKKTNPRYSSVAGDQQNFVVCRWDAALKSRGQCAP